MNWTHRSPEIDDFDGDHAYYWFKSNRLRSPVIIRVNKGTKWYDDETFKIEINIEPHALSLTTALHFVWRGSSEWPKGEWAGPIPEPSTTPSQTSPHLFEYLEDGSIGPLL